MKNVVLFGSSGQLGKLVKSTCPEHLVLNYYPRNKVDITDHQKIRIIIQQQSPDYIINCSAYTAVDQAEKDLENAYSVNSLAVQNIINSVESKTRIIHISTDFVFHHKNNSPYKTTDKCSPVSVYGKSKLDGENALVNSSHRNYVILRTSWLYSAENKNFVTTMLKLMNSQNKLNIVNDQYGSPTSALTLAETIWKLVLNESAEGVFHWSDKGVISWYQFAQEIYKFSREIGLLSKETTICPIPTADFPTPAVRPEYSALDSSKTESLLGIHALPWKEQLHKVLIEIKRSEIIDE